MDSEINMDQVLLAAAFAEVFGVNLVEPQTGLINLKLFLGQLSFFLRDLLTGFIMRQEKLRGKIVISSK